MQLHTADKALLCLADLLEALNGSPIRNEGTAIPLSSFLGQPDVRVVHGVISPHAVIASDASNQASCSYDVRGAGGLFHQEMFTEEEAALSSGHRELLAVQHALQVMPLAGRTSALSVFWLTDSQNLVTFLSKGSSRRHIQMTVLEIYRLDKFLRLDIIPVHLKHSYFCIQVADYGSRFYDVDD